MVLHYLSNLLGVKLFSLQPRDKENKSREEHGIFVFFSTGIKLWRLSTYIILQKKKKKVYKACFMSISELALSVMSCTSTWHFLFIVLIYFEKKFLKLWSSSIFVYAFFIWKYNCVCFPPPAIDRLWKWDCSTLGLTV